MRIRLMVIALLLLLFCGVVKAQENKPQKWYWAWCESSQTLLAYTVDGQVNRLLKGQLVKQIWLGENNTAIAVVLDEKQYMFYKLTPTEAIAIKADFDTRAPHYDARFSLHKLDSSRWLVYTTESDKQILIDQDKLQAQLINHKLTRYTSVALDHQAVWFLADPDQDDTQTLWNVSTRDLNTGNERVLHKQKKPFPEIKLENLKCEVNPAGDQRLCWLVTELKASSRTDMWLINSNGTTLYKEIHPSLAAENFSINCVSAMSGDQWLCQSFNSDSNASGFSIWVVSRNGDIQPVLERSDSRGYRWNVLFTQDGFAIIDERCKSECAIEVYPDGLSKPVLYPVNQEYLPLYHPAGVDILKDKLLLLNDQVFLLNKDGVLNNLGRFFCCESVNSLSPDLKWVVLTGADFSTARIWNLETGKLEYEYPLQGDMLTSVDYYENGFVMTELYSPQTMVYLYDKQKPIKILGNGSAFVIDLLADDTVIVDDHTGNDERFPGIYHYDPVTHKYTLLVADAHKINYAY